MIVTDIAPFMPSGNGSAAGHPGTGVDRARAKTLFAGYVITGFANGVMILALGTALAMTDQDDDAGGGGITHIMCSPASRTLCGA